MSESKQITVSDLKRKFEESKSELSDHLAECRTNNNLFQGNHFHKKQQKLTRSLEGSGVSEDTKIRVVKNHTQVVCKYIINSILSLAPTGIVEPNDEAEMSDIKAAEIHKEILEDYKHQNKIDDHIRRWTHDYVVSGECFVNVFWDNTKGRKIKPSPYVDIMGQVIQGEPFFSGDVVIERIFPWDVRMDTGAKSFEEAMWIGYEKMVDKDVIRRIAPDHPELEKILREDEDTTYKVFEAGSGKYKESKGKVLLCQAYLRPSSDHPNGQFIFFNKDIEIIRGDLPVDQNGNVFFPIKYVGFDEIPTSPRSSSIIRMFRPEQMQVNFCASAIAQTLTTIGWDKMIVPTGGEVETGSTKAGVRIFKVPGGKQSADFIPGRSGEQFLATMQQNITEIYNKTGVPEQWDEKTNDADVMAVLYKNMRQRTRFSLYAKKFGDFLCDVFEEVLRLKKAYMTDEEFFLVTGGQEYGNIAEFRRMEDLGYQIRIDEGSEDLESRFGRYMGLMQTMQYLGSNLDDNAKGMILRNLPFINGEEITSKMTVNYDNSRNIMLALDRGEMPPITDIGDPLYISEQLNARRYKPDFKYLNPQIQQVYLQQIQAYNQIYNEKAAAVQRAQSGFIPADGPTVPIEGMYEETIGSNGQPKYVRLQVPQASLKWLQEQLQAQGAALGNIANLPLGTQAAVAEQFNNQQQMGQQPMMPQQM
jgi:hypothetical protein